MTAIKAPEELVQQIALCVTKEEKRSVFNEFRAFLDNPALLKNKKIVIPLLYDADAYIRREAAFAVETLGIRLKKEDYARYLYALQDFPALKAYCSEFPAAEQLLFDGFKDKNLRLRARLLKYIHEKDCRTMQEKILYFYGRGDYESLIQAYFNCNETDRAFLLDLLRQGTQEQHNMPYHRRQCALLLEKLSGAEALDEEIQALLEAPKKSASKIPLHIDRRPLVTPSALDLLVDKLQRSGLWQEGRPLFPQINIGPATGRVTYRNPGVQTWPKEQRLRLLRPPQNEVLIFDYQSIEPRILLNILLNEHLLSIADIPEQDVYEALNPLDRAAGKRFLNSLINGGRRRPDFNPGKFFWKLLPALDELRAELWMRYNQSGVVETIGGRRLKLDRKAANLSGKIMNRLIQGSAADFFNQAVIQIDDRLEQKGLPARVYFLLFDEVWLAAEPGHVDEVAAQTLSILNNQHQRYNFTLGIEARMQRLASP